MPTSLAQHIQLEQEEHIFLEQVFFPQYCIPPDRSNDNSPFPGEEELASPLGCFAARGGEKSPICISKLR